MSLHRYLYPDTFDGYLELFTGDLLESATCYIDAQWGLNLVGMRANGVPESQPNVPGARFMSPGHSEEVCFIRLSKEIISTGKYDKHKKVRLVCTKVCV